MQICSSLQFPSILPTLTYCMYQGKFCLDLNLANRFVLSQPKVKFNYFISAQLSPRVQEIAKSREIECRATTGLAVDESMPGGVSNSKPRIWVGQGQICWQNSNPCKSAQVCDLHSANFDILYLDEFCLDLNLANRSVLSQPKVKFNYFMSAQLSPRVQEIAKPREIECRATTGLAVDESMPYGVSKPRIWVRQGQIFWQNSNPCKSAQVCNFPPFCQL